MKVYIIAAVSADGFIAKNKDQLIDWTSKEDKKFFSEMTRKSGVMVLGGNTFRTFKALLPGRRHIVYTKGNISNPDVETTAEEPKDLIKRLAGESLSEVAICGGSSIYSMFLDSGQVTDVYLTVEPLIFGKGVKLLDSQSNIKLKLQSVKKLNNDTILVHYKI
jgi:dihydrofolate reductase